MKLGVRLAVVAGFAGLIALAAQVSVPMVPVPMTLQTFAVLLAGAVLGGGWGAVAVLLYLALAALGLPVLSDGAGGWARFAGPTAGYLLAFPLAAGLSGYLASRPVFRAPLAETGLMIAAHLFILALGAGWLATRIGPAEALAVGVTPFLLGAVIKSVAVVAAASGLRRLALFRRG